MSFRRRVLRSQSHKGVRWSAGLMRKLREMRANGRARKAMIEERISMRREREKATKAQAKPKGWAERLRSTLKRVTPAARRTG